jgi:hypothetical protein
VEIKCQLDATDGFYCRSYCLLNMFREPLCPSSRAQEYYTDGCCLWYWVLWFFKLSVRCGAECYVSGLPVAAGRPSNRQSIKKHNTYQLLYIYSIPPDDGPQISPKHLEVDWRNKLRIYSVSSWFLLHRYIEMHGQGNIKLNSMHSLFWHFPILYQSYQWPQAFTSLASLKKLRTEHVTKF